MAKLDDATIKIIFDLQRQLLERIDEATATEAIVFERFGENEARLELDQLQNSRERTTSSYSRLYRLLLRVAEAQPQANSATLDLLAESIEQAAAINSASQASIQEIKRDWNLS